MKRFISALLLVLFLTSQALGAGQVTTIGTVDPIPVQDWTQRMVIPITFTADDATAAISSVTINPTTYHIEGWYLYKIKTDPGATGPTNGAWDVDLTDANGYVVTRNLVDDRSSTTTQEVIFTSGYPIIEGNWTFSIGDNAVNAATATVYLTFVAN